MAASIQKVSIAIGNEELEWARQRADREGSSVSAVLTSIARDARNAEQREARQQKAWRAYLAWAEDGPAGPITEADLEAAARELDGEAPDEGEAALAKPRRTRKRAVEAAPAKPARRARK